jgi:hypothetical protein
MGGDGIYVDLHPLPEDLPPQLARVITREITTIIANEDLEALTKRQIRQKVRDAIVAKLATTDLADPDVMSLRLYPPVLDFELPTFKDWINRCTTLCLDAV